MDDLDRKLEEVFHELLYKDFRDVYISQKEVEIINLEQNAYENYMTAKFSLDEAHLTNGLTNLWIKRTI